ncbi:MAG: hypothetical protein IJG45_04100 [Oscillospiraceae bacterium]|nr:hypothetical protein [Oscillospiraceae bacterium]
MNYLKRKKNEAESLNGYYVIENVLCGIIVLTIIFNMSALTSAALTLSFVVVLIHFGKLLVRGLTKTMIFVIFIIILSLFAVCIASVTYNVQISFEYMKEYILFATAIVFMCIAAEDTINRRTTSFILKFQLIVACIYPIAYFILPDLTSNIGLHFNFTNTNLTGMWLLQSVLFSFVGFMSLKGAWRILSLTTAAFNILFIILTNARNTYLAFALFLGLFLWNLLKQKPRYSKVFVIFLLLLPLIFIPLYFWLVDPVTENGWLDFLVSEGKQLDSRLTIWNRAIRYLNVGSGWLFGNYPYLQGNLHNAYMVLLGSYGTLTLISVLGYMILIVCQVNEKTHSSFGRYCLAGFLAGMLLGIGEGAFFSGGVGLSLVITFFLFMARGDLDTKQLNLPMSKEKKKKGKYAGSKYIR